MTVLEIRDLRAGVSGKEILRGIDLTVASGEVHAVMGPNGSGKSTLSHVLMGRPGYEVLGGTVTLNGVRTSSPSSRGSAPRPVCSSRSSTRPRCRASASKRWSAPRSRRAGATSTDLAARLVREAERIGFDERFLARPLNVDLSGGEKKRNETVQLAVLEPAIAILDELDSGLDVDALRACARRIEAATKEQNLGVLAITHYVPTAARAARGPGAHPRAGTNREVRRRHASRPSSRRTGTRPISTDPWSRRSSPS